MGRGVSPCSLRRKPSSDTRQKQREARHESLSLRRNDRLSVYVDERRALAWVDAQGGRLTDAIAELLGGGRPGLRARPTLFRTGHP